MKIKFLCNAVKWFDRINGNTYHSCRIIRCKDGAIIYVPFQYGYGTHYRQSSLEAMAKAGWLPATYNHRSAWHLYERQNGYPIHWTVSNDLKRECIANGKA